MKKTVKKNPKRSQGTKSRATEKESGSRRHRSRTYYNAINYNGEQMLEIGRLTAKHIAWEQMYTSILSLLVAKEEGAQEWNNWGHGRIEQLAEIADHASDIGIQRVLKRRRAMDEVLQIIQTTPPSSETPEDVGDTPVPTGDNITKLKEE